MSEGEDGRDVGNGWFAYLTEEGDEYYYNEQLDETLWELPPSIYMEMKGHVANSEESCRSSLAISVEE